MNENVKIIEGDLLNAFDLCAFDAIAHCCNCFHTMGGGIARIIAKKYPAAEEADNKTKYGDRDKLGTVSSTTELTQGTIYNIYGQFGTSTNERALSYDAFIKGLETVRDLMKARGEIKLGVPYKIASALAGGDWNVVLAMINSVFTEDSGIHVFIYRLPGVA